MSRTKKLVLSALLALSGWGSAVVLSRFLYSAWFANVYFTIVLFCALIVHAHLRRYLSDAIFVVLAAALFILFQSVVLHLPIRLVQSLSILGFSSFMTLGFRAIWITGGDRRALKIGFTGAGLLISLYLFSMPALTLMGQLHPKVLDLYLYSFDASLHFQPSFLAGVAYAKSPFLRWLGQAFYVGLPVSLALVFAGQLVLNRERAVQAITAFFIGGPLGLLTYNFFPALGPRYVFQTDFPFHPLSTSQAARLMVEPVPVHGFINAMPSMHMAWVLLAWWYSRGLSWIYRAVAMSFVVFTIFATLGSGEHYFADLIVAFPFALLIEALCASSLSWKDESRLRGIALGLLGTFLWFVLLRFENRLFWASAIVPWSLAVAAMASVFTSHSRIAAALILNSSSALNRDVLTVSSTALPPHPDPSDASVSVIDAAR